MKDVERSDASRAGYVALVGLPNVGKSTLMNALVGEKLSIVTARPQTTRERVTGILTTGATQIIFLDTPGLLEPRYLLQASMLEAARRAVEDADIVLLILDPTRPGETEHPADALELLLDRRGSLVLAVNKVDAATPEAVSEIVEWGRSTFGVDAIRISAAAGDGLDPLLEELRGRLPESPFFYPEDELAIQPVRYFVAELVRETIFEEYSEEIPYSTVVRIEEFKEEGEPVVIRATIFVERESQKGILIGKGGVALRRVGTRSRQKIESFLGRRVFLDLWVKSLPRWRRRPTSMRYLGYAVPGESS